MSHPEETLTPSLSIEESVLRLKTEILSVDWRITEKRADLLETAFSCLKQRFKNRKSVFAIIVMASNVLGYIRQKGESKIPATIDFLKEAMAHIVTFYEDPQFDPENDKKVFKSIHRRFSQLKEKIHSEHQQDKKSGNGDAPLPDGKSTEQVLKEAAAQSLFLRKLDLPELENDKKPAASVSPFFAASVTDEPRDPDQQSLETLVRELKDCLGRAEEIGTIIRQLLADLLSRQQMTLPSMDAFLPGATSTMDSHPVPTGENPPPPAAGSFSTGNDGPVVELRENLPTPCDRTDLLLIQLGEARIAVEARYVAAKKPVQESRRPVYLKNSEVALKDFGRFLQSLSGQFTGCLATMKNGKLRNLSLPLLTPRGINLPDKPMESAEEMLVLCNGNWCGILLCSPVPVNPGEAVMVASRQCNDGDLVKTALTEDDREIPLLNSIELLKREGNMVIA